MSAIETAAGALPEAAAEETAAERLPWLTWGFLTALLAVEILGLTLRFDSGALIYVPGPTAWLLGQAGFALQCAVAAAVMALLWRGRALLAELRASASPARRGIARPLAVHVAALSLFAFLCAQVFEDASPTPALAAAWLAAGLTTVGTWATVALPVGVWLRLLRCLGFVLPAAAALGVLSIALGHLARELWLPFGQITLAAVEAGLKLCGQDVVARPDDLLIGTAQFRVRIAPSCSGYEGMALAIVFIGLFLWLDRRTLRFPVALALLPLAAVLMWWVNAARIATLILIGTWGWRDVALGGFHSQAGWVGLLGVTLGLMTWTRRSSWFLQSEVYAVRGAALAEESPNPAAAYLGPLMALLAGVLITRALSQDFDFLYPLRLLPAAVVLWHYRRSYTLGGWAPSWQSVAIGAAAFGLWLLLGEAAASEPLGPWDVLPPAAALGWVAVRVIGATVIVPLAEELAFRGFLMRRLIGAPFDSVPLGTFSWLSFVGSSVAFGLLHERWLAGIVAGLLYALALYQRRKLVDAIVAHGVTNALLAAHVLARGQWSFWL
jgi:exosortase E/protease (VPEID-CTERM system)